MTTGAESIAAAFKAAPGRAALMPYMMGGFPDLRTSIEIGLACADAGADVIELGVPFSDPLADGPVIHAAATRALAAGATLPAIVDAGARIAERVPVVLMCYANPILARGVERFTQELAALRRVAELEGIIPALESSHAIAWALASDAGRAGTESLDLICLSGRGDKDLAEVLPKLGIGQ